MATLVSVAGVIRQNPEKRGLAIIVTNDYSDRNRGPDGVPLTPLGGPEKDGEKMQRAFRALGIATYWVRNPRLSELEGILNEVTQLSPCPRGYNSISFVFSGHGYGTDSVCMQDGKVIRVQDIVDYFLPKRARNIGCIPKLLFIDACRGSNKIKPVVVPYTCSRDASVQINGPVFEKEIQRRGATSVNTLLIPPDGNILVAYSTTTSHQAHERPDGGVWMNAVATKLSTSEENVETLLSQVRRELFEKYQGPEWVQYMQMPETICLLIGPVYLKNPARSCRIVNPQEPVGCQECPPLSVTQRSVTHPGHYRGRLLNFEQCKIIDIVDTSVEGNTAFTCTIKLVIAASKQSLTFQSGKDMRTKDLAKESAAKKAVNHLDKMATQQAVPTHQPTLAPAATHKAASNSPKSSYKDPVSRLKEYCDKNHCREQYDWKECESNGKFMYSVTVQGKTYQGGKMQIKKEAKKDAAQKAVNALKC